MYRPSRTDALLLVGLTVGLRADQLLVPDANAGGLLGADGAPLDDIRDIAVAGGRVWVATQAGLAAYGREDGALLFTLRAADGLGDDSLYVVEPLPTGELLVGTRRGAAVLGNLGGTPPAAGRPDAVRVRPIPGTGRDVVLDVLQSNAATYVVCRERGLVPLERGADGWTVGSGPVRGRGYTAGAAHGGRLVLGALDGGVGVYPEQARLPYASHDDGAVRRSRHDLPVLDLAAAGPDLLLAAGTHLLALRGDEARPVADAHTPIPAAVAVSSPGGALIGTLDGRIYGYGAGQLTLLSRAARGITALAADGDRVWVGVRRQGLHVVHLPIAPRS